MGYRCVEGALGSWPKLEYWKFLFSGPASIRFSYHSEVHWQRYIKIVWLVAGVSLLPL